MKRTILLIDDCDMMLRFLTPVLNSEFEVVSLKNPIDGILWLKTNPSPDLMILDHDLPGLTGLELLQNLRKDDRWQNIPVIMLSGIKDVEKRWQCLQFGADDFLSKPFHPRELTLRVHMALNKANSPAMA